MEYTVFRFVVNCFRVSQIYSIFVAMCDIVHNEDRISTS